MVYQALSCRPFTTEARVLFWAGPCAICGKLALEQGFLGVLLFFHISNILTLGFEMDKLELGQVVLCVLQLTVVITILPMGFVLEGVALRLLWRSLSLSLHRCSLRWTQWHSDSSLSGYFRFPLSVSVHQCSTLPSTADAVQRSQ